MLKTLTEHLNGHGLEVTLIGPGVLRVSQSDGDIEADVSLAQLSRRLDLSDASSHMRILRAFSQRIASAFGIPQQLELQDIFPRIMPKIEDTRLGAPWTFPIAGGLEGALVQDQGVNLRLLPPLELVRLGDGLASIRAAALQNLRSLPCSFEWEAVGSGQAVQNGDGYMAARALILEDWRKEPCWLGLPSRDELWLWDTPPSVHCQMQLKECHLRAPYAISGQFWLWTPDGGIQPWVHLDPAN